EGLRFPFAAKEILGVLGAERGKAEVGCLLLGGSGYLIAAEAKQPFAEPCPHRLVVALESERSGDELRAEAAVPFEQEKLFRRAGSRCDRLNERPQRHERRAIAVDEEGLAVRHPCAMQRTAISSAPAHSHPDLRLVRPRDYKGVFEEKSDRPQEL